MRSPHDRSWNHGRAFYAATRNEKTAARGYTGKSSERLGTCPVEGVRRWAMTGAALCVPNRPHPDASPGQNICLQRCLSSPAGMVAVVMHDTVDCKLDTVDCKLDTVLLKSVTW